MKSLQRAVAGVDEPGLPLAKASVAERTRTDLMTHPERGTERRALLELDDRLRDLRAALDRVRTDSNLLATTRRVSPHVALPVATSRAALDLDPIPTFTTLGSTEEVNATPTSFAPFGPTIQGSSTALPTLGGVYDGAQGDDTLTFTIRQNRTVGEDRNLLIVIRDSSGGLVDRPNFRNVPADTPITLSNGMTLAFGAGAVRRNDIFEVQVSASVGSAVDPTKPFDGTRNDIPNFEAGLAVSAGSFDVNGVTISVAADDTLQAVVDRIDASAAGVAAVFDTQMERVLLTQKTAGSAPEILLGGDTSGFLAAVKLAGASQVRGQDAADPVALRIAQVPSLSAIGNGTFSVNGVAIGVDTAADSLGDVLDRINQSGAGVTATLDPASRLLTIASDDRTADLVLEDGSSGFLGAMRIVPGTYEPRQARTTGEARHSRSQLAAVRRDVQQIGRTLDRIFADGSERTRSGVFDRARGPLREAIEATFRDILDADPGSTLRSGFGLDFRLDAGSVSFDAERFASAIERDFGSVRTFLFGEPGGGEDASGLIASLLAHLDGLQSDIAGQLGLFSNPGRLIDFRV